MMDIVAIMGSPRRHGNTDRLLDEMIKGAQDKGHNVVKHYSVIWMFIPAVPAECACRERSAYLMMTGLA